MPGTVYLVGAGPGDPELLTLRAARLLATADVVVHDRLVDERILSLAPGALRHYVGKSAGDHAVPQTEICRLLETYARAHRRVVRLKGGDPLVFGRGGEEYAALIRAGIRCEIVPGITAALGAAASLAIPLTHRDFSASLVLLTGHRRTDQRQTITDLLRCDPAHKTIVVYMGVTQLADITGAVLAVEPERAAIPAALVENATLPGERVLWGTFGDITVRAREAGVGSPALLVLGPAVDFAREMAALAARIVEA